MNEQKFFAYNCGRLFTMLLLLAWAGMTAIAAGADEPATYFDRDGVRLYYTMHGDDNPYAIILSGGPGLSNRYMQAVANEIAKTYRAVMLEQRATGRSELAEVNTDSINFRAYIADLEALRLHLGVEKLTLVGNSWGMMLALAYAGQHPDQIGAIVTLGSGPISSEYAL